MRRTQALSFSANRNTWSSETGTKAFAKGSFPVLPRGFDIGRMSEVVRGKAVRQDLLSEPRGDTETHQPRVRAEGGLEKGQALLEELASPSSRPLTDVRE